MRILFLRHLLKNIGGTGVYTKIIIDELIRRGHKIGFWPSDRLIFKDFFKKDIKLYDIQNQKLEESWDVIILQHADTLYNAKNILEQLKNVPIIFISHSSAPNDQIVTDSRIIKVLKVAEGVTSTYWDFPQELIEVHRNPIIINYSRPYINLNESKRIVLLTRLGEDKANFVRYIIYSINKNPKYRLLIAGRAIFYEKFYAISNSNIEFLGEIENTQQLLNEADLVIGSGRAVMEAIASKKPVLVAGYRGLGELVTPQNFSKYKKCMFSGRIGGEKGEAIDSNILREMIDEIFQYTNLAEITKINHELLKSEFEHTLVVQKLENTIKECIEINRMVDDSIQILQLKPMLVSNCNFNVNNSEIIIERAASGKQICNIDSSLHKFLLNLDGNKTIKQLMRQQGNNKITLLENIRSLWKLKIVFFI